MTWTWSRRSAPSSWCTSPSTPAGSGPRVRRSDDEDATAQHGEGVARVEPGTKVKVGDKITFAVNVAGMQFFDPETEQAIWK